MRVPSTLRNRTIQTKNTSSLWTKVPQSSRAVLLDHKCECFVEIAQREFTQIYPRAGWVEHNPMEISATQSSTLSEVVAKSRHYLR